MSSGALSVGKDTNTSLEVYLEQIIQECTKKKFSKSYLPQILFGPFLNT